MSGIDLQSIARSIGAAQGAVTVTESFAISTNAPGFKNARVVDAHVATFTAEEREGIAKLMARICITYPEQWPGTRQLALTVRGDWMARFRK